MFDQIEHTHFEQSDHPQPAFRGGFGLLRRENRREKGENGGKHPKLVSEL
jgi:hypothetical protein